MKALALVGVLATGCSSALRDFLAKPEQWSGLLEKARAAPRTKAGITPYLSALVAVGRLKGRPGPRAMECFEAGLTIGHLLRMGKEGDAVREYEGLLRTVEALVR